MFRTAELRSSSGVEENGRGLGIVVRILRVLRLPLSRLIAFGVCAACVGSCGGPSSDSVDGRAPILLFAAASTSEAVSRVAAAFEEETSVRVAISFASSATLSRQIVAGADADVFLSAHSEWVDTLEDAGRVSARAELLGNRLVIIVPDDSDLAISSAEDLRAASVERIALGDPDTVPAGMYAKAALVHGGQWDAIADKVVPAANVRQALLYVERGEVEAGIVYSTDAAISGKVRVVASVEPAPGRPVRYSLVLVANDTDDPDARRLFDFLQSEAAMSIFTELGFEVLRSSLLWTETGSG